MTICHKEIECKLYSAEKELKVKFVNEFVITYSMIQ